MKIGADDKRSFPFCLKYLTVFFCRIANRLFEKAAEIVIVVKPDVRSDFRDLFIGSTQQFFGLVDAQFTDIFRDPHSEVFAAFQIESAAADPEIGGNCIDIKRVRQVREKIRA